MRIWRRLHCLTAFSSYNINLFHCIHKTLEVNRISVSAPNVDKWALSADVRFRPKAVIPHSVHFRFRRAAVGKLGEVVKHQIYPMN